MAEKRTRVELGMRVAELEGMVGPMAQFSKQVALAEKRGVKVVEVNAFKYNLKWDRKRQVLLDNEGRDVPFETWGKEADCG